MKLVNGALTTKALYTKQKNYEEESRVNLNVRSFQGGLSPSMIPLWPHSEIWVQGFRLELS